MPCGLLSTLVTPCSMAGNPAAGLARGPNGWVAAEGERKPAGRRCPWRAGHETCSSVSCGVGRCCNANELGNSPVASRGTDAAKAEHATERRWSLT